MSNYHHAEYEDFAALIKRLKSTVAYSSVPCSAADIVTDLEKEVMQLFKNSGQSFNKTRFLNATKLEDFDAKLSAEDSETKLTLREQTMEEYCRTHSAQIVQSCETDTLEAKSPHIHEWNDDTLAYTICTETYAYQQAGQKALFEAAYNL